MAGDWQASEQFAAIEESVYEAALVPDRWPTALERLAQCADGFGAVLFSVTEWSTHWAASPELRPTMAAFVEEGWAARNSRMANGLRKGLHLEPRFVTEADYYGPGELEQDPLHLEFFWPRGFGYSAGTIAQLPHGDMLCYSVENRRDQGPVQPAAQQRLDALRPHLLRAATLAARLGVERARTAVETLAQLGFAAAAVTAQGRVLVANPAFEAAETILTTRGGDRIALLDRVADAALAVALARIGGVAGTRSLPLRGSDGLVRSVVHVVPVRRLANDIFSQAQAVLVVTTAVDGTGSPALLQALFDLTAAEAALARQLAGGRSIEQIAAETGRSSATLRNQLKSVLAKTGCHRQSELVGLLTRLVPAGL